MKETRCLVVTPAEHVTSWLLGALLPPVVPHLWVGASLEDAAQVIQDARAKDGLVLCDARNHFDPGDIDSWPAQLTDPGVEWLSISAVRAPGDPFIDHPRRRRLELSGSPAVERWGTGILGVDVYGTVPTSGVRIIKERIPMRPREGREHPLSRHLLRSGFARALGMTVNAGDANGDGAAISEPLETLRLELAQGRSALIHAFDSGTPLSDRLFGELRAMASGAGVTMTTVELQGASLA